MCKCPSCKENLTGTLIDVYIAGAFDRIGVAYFVCPFCGDLLRAQITGTGTDITVSRKAGKWNV